MSAEPGPSLTIIAELKRALGDDAVLTGAGIGGRHRSDASRTGRHLPKAVEEIDAAAETMTVKAGTPGKVLNR